MQVSEFACRALRSLLASSWPGAGSSGPEVAKLFPNLVATLEERLEASLKECGGEEGDEHNVLRECTSAVSSAFVPCRDSGYAGRGYAEAARSLLLVLPSWFCSLMNPCDGPHRRLICVACACSVRGIQASGYTYHTDVGGHTCIYFLEIFTCWI